ncbi:MAG TPA: ATP-binding protein [Nostoc sp.]|uniref:ATP-binding protein n=1 Tax=Nostoc sp. TaxID=1180 RepID=UPI002D625F7B|nr:ATP-binding protein [Nostoc sp.]HYX15746.1 ATP-binding protein [Nostoc sp.]
MVKDLTRDSSVRIRDDGAGLDLGRIEALARKRGILEKGTATDDDIAAFIFHSGLSTAEKVTDISGRGVGMDAVKALVEAHGGKVAITFLGSRKGNHRCFELTIQLRKISSASEGVKLSDYPITA